jgi:hypothetical protein
MAARPGRLRGRSARLTPGWRRVESRRRGEGQAQAGEAEEALLRLEEAVRGVPAPAREPEAAAEAALGGRRGDRVAIGEALTHAQAARAGGRDEPAPACGRQQSALAPARRARHPDAGGVVSLVVARCHGGPV